MSAVLSVSTMSTVLIVIAIVLLVVGPIFVGFGYGKTKRRRASTGMASKSDTAAKDAA